MGTLERALDESRIFDNAHRGHGVRNSGRADPFDDPMDLTFQAPVARHASLRALLCGHLPPRRGVLTVDRLDICVLLVGCLGAPHRLSPSAGVLDSPCPARRVQTRRSFGLMVYFGAVSTVAPRAVWSSCVLLVHRLPGCLDNFPQADFRRCRSKMDSQVR